jgi:hypothetical protein
MKSIAAVLLLLASTGIASAQNMQSVPKIDITPTCKAAAKGSAGLVQDYDSCRRSEDAARETLVKQWSSFSVADRGSCYRLTTTGTPGTYTELLTCLEMRRDARKFPDTTTIGQGVNGQGTKSK